MIKPSLSQRINARWAGGREGALGRREGVPVERYEACMGPRACASRLSRRAGIVFSNF